MEEEKKKVVEGKEVIPLLIPYNMGKFNLSHRYSVLPRPSSH